MIAIVCNSALEHGANKQAPETACSLISGRT